MCVIALVWPLFRGVRFVCFEGDGWGAAVASHADGGRVFRLVGLYFFRCKGVGPLRDAVSSENLIEGVEEDEKIHPQGEVALVAQVVADALPKGEVVAPEYLGKSGDARADGHPPHAGVRGKGGHLFGNPGARPDDAHVSQDDVDDFRQFVQRGAAEDFTDASGAQFVGQELSVFIACVAHGFEFDDGEFFAVSTYAFLEEKGVAALQEEEGEVDEQQQGK